MDGVRVFFWILLLFRTRGELEDEPDSMVTSSASESLANFANFLAIPDCF